MKKVIKSALLFAVIGGTLSLVSCEDEVVVADTANYATISGKANCDFDQSNTDANEDNVPEGTVVVATVDPSGYNNNTDNNVNYENVVYTTTVSAGVYSFDSVAVYGNAVTVNISYADFRSDYTDFADNNVEDAIFSTADQSVTVEGNETQLVDAIWN